MSKRKILLGVAVGAAVGTALGVLIAPAKGSAIRKKLLRKGTVVTNDAKKKLGEYSDAATDEYENIKKRVNGLVKKGKKEAASLVRKKR